MTSTAHSRGAAREPFWKDLTKQADLEAQYDVLLRQQVKHVYTNKEVAIFLARFAEARIFAAADKRITELESRIAKLLGNEP